MSEQGKLVIDDVNDAEDPLTLRRRERQARRAARRADREAGGWTWLGGVLLIAIGGLFLLQNAGYLQQFSNWWALFILLPAAGSFSAALAAYQRSDGEWTREAVGPLAAGVLLVGLTAVFFFGLDLSLFGPLLLIAGGLLLVFGPR